MLDVLLTGVNAAFPLSMLRLNKPIRPAPCDGEPFDCLSLTNTGRLENSIDDEFCELSLTGVRIPPPDEHPIIKIDKRTRKGKWYLMGTTLHDQDLMELGSSITYFKDCQIAAINI